MELASLQHQLREQLIAIAQEHGARNLRIFGSVARGQAGPLSDIDFLVDLDAGRDLFDLGSLQADFQDLLQMPVDVIETSCLHPVIRDRVLSECIPL